MNVVYLISRAKKGAGPINQALNILVGLERLSDVHAILVTLETEREDDSWLERFREKSIEIIQLNQKKWKLWSCVYRLKKIIKDKRIDVIHSSGFRADVVNMFVRNKVGTVSTQRNHPDNFGEKYNWMIRKSANRLHLYVVSKMDVIVTCSESLQHQYKQDCKRDVLAVQNGVDTDTYTPINAENKGSLRVKLGVDTKGIFYLVMGWLKKKKNVGMIIEAFKAIDEPRIRLLIMGDGSQEMELRAMAKDDERILFLGKKNNPLEYIQTSDVLISASLSEGLPNTVLEALSCGLPCILSDIDPHKEIIEGTEAGVLFDRNDSKALQEAINMSLTWDLSTKSQMAREVAISGFGIDKLAAGYLKIYHEVRNHHAL